MNKDFQDEIFAHLSLVADEAKPMAGTDITGRNQHQYTRLCLVQLPAGSYQMGKFAKDRIFVVMAESSWLFDSVHQILKTEEWIKTGFDDKYIYIEEVLHRPRTGETLNEYTSYIAQNENDIWLAIFTYITKLGILDRSAKKMMSKTYRLPDSAQPPTP
jgi:hypothetical protein